jgi:hypothetical protein
VEGEVAVDESHRLPETLLYFLFHGFKNLGPGNSITFCDVYMPSRCHLNQIWMVVMVSVGGEACKRENVRSVIKWDNLVKGAEMILPMYE